MANACSSLDTGAAGALNISLRAPQPGALLHRAAGWALRRRDSRPRRPASTSSCPWEPPDRTTRATFDQALARGGIGDLNPWCQTTARTATTSAVRTTGSARSTTSSPVLGARRQLANQPGGKHTLRDCSAPHTSRTGCADPRRPAGRPARLRALGRAVAAHGPGLPVCRDGPLDRRLPPAGHPAHRAGRALRSDHRPGGAVRGGRGRRRRGGAHRYVRSRGLARRSPLPASPPS